MGGDGRAVVPHLPRSQLEGPGDAVIGDGPADGGGRLRLKLGIEIDKGVGEQILHATITLVDARVVEGDLVARVVARRICSV